MTRFYPNNPMLIAWVGGSGATGGFWRLADGHAVWAAIDFAFAAIIAVTLIRGDGKPVMKMKLEEGESAWVSADGESRVYDAEATEKLRRLRDKIRFEED